jgi:hypothetical protein
MKLKTIAAIILSLAIARATEPAQFANRERENILIKEIPPGQALLMVQIRYEDESKLKSGYAEPLLYLYNRRAEGLRAVELSLENCCSGQKFLIRHLGGLQPVPFWNSRGIEPLDGKSLAFPGNLQNDQIVPNEKVKMTHFRVLAEAHAGTAVIFLIGPLEEVKKSYKIRLGQIFTWDSPRVFE